MFPPLGPHFSNFNLGGLCKVGDILPALRASTNYQLTFPGTGINDVNGNLMLGWTSPGTAIAPSVNVIQFSSSITATNPSLSAIGSDLNIGININTKGLGLFNVLGTGGIVIPYGTTAQRPVGVPGLVRTNQDTGLLEFWDTLVNQYVSLTISSINVSPPITTTGGLIPTIGLATPLAINYGGTASISYTAGSVIFAGTGGTNLTQDNANFNWNDSTYTLSITQPSSYSSLSSVLVITSDPSGTHGHGKFLEIAGNPGGGGTIFRTDGGLNKSWLQLYGGDYSGTESGGLYINGNNSTDGDAGGIQTTFGLASSTFDMYDYTQSILLFQVNNSGLLKLPFLGANSAVATDASNELVASSTTATELGYVHGVTSAIQTQFSNKQPLATNLTDIASLTPTNGEVIVGNGTHFVDGTAANISDTYSPVNYTATSATVDGNFQGVDNALGAIPSTFTWTSPSTSESMVANHGYFTRGLTQVVMTLPVTAAGGDTFIVSNTTAAGFQIAQNALQSIRFGNLTTAVGIAGSITSNNIGDTITIVCDTPNTGFIVTSNIGTLSCAI
jgi:hypothetical protein